MELRFGKARWLPLVLGLALALGLFAGCEREKTEDFVETTAATEGPTAPADGNPEDVTCQGSYSVDAEQANAAADTVVAVMGSGTLTNGQLQVYYGMEIAAFRQEQHEVSPDFDQPLDTQLCGTDETAVTWQQYFLQRALETWRRNQALILLSRDEVLATEEAYQPDLETHAKNLENAPATKYLYGYSEHYQINELHQAYLDSLPELLDTMAQEKGLADVGALAQAIAGPGAMAEDLIRFAELYNEGYMYFTSRSYDMTPDAGVVEAYFAENEAAYAEEGITRDSGKYVDIRHILLVPENATVAADGTVTCGEGDWKRCYQSARTMLSSWKSGKSTEATFAERAYEDSADVGSSINGGLYSNLRQGQLTAELDAWCFDDARKTGDTEIIRTSCGYHILYFVDSREVWYAAAEEDLIAQMSAELVESAVEAYPVSIDYSAICLGLTENRAVTVLAEELLYPDVAHERYPSVPLYLQQDYPEAMYGKFKLSSHGCGPCSLAMIATYLTDTEISPVSLAKKYGNYCLSVGSDIKLIENVPAELGCYVDRHTYKWSEVQEALENGETVICVVGPGHFTSSGHYMALEAVTEDGLIVVRDSNLKNYGKLEGHEIDGFEPGKVSASGKSYWIFQKKVTRIPVCARCGEAEGEGICTAMFAEDYLCEKCTAATQRRENYIAACKG